MNLEKSAGANGPQWPGSGPNDPQWPGSGPNDPQWPGAGSGVEPELEPELQSADEMVSMPIVGPAPTGANTTTEFATGYPPPGAVPNPGYAAVPNAGYVAVPPPTAPPRRRVPTFVLVLLPLLIGALVVSVIVLLVMNSSDDSKSSAGPASGRVSDRVKAGTSITACAQPPTFAIDGVTVNWGDIVAHGQFTAGCADGDILSSPAVTVSVIGANGLPVAAGLFDFSNNIVVMPGTNDGSVEVNFHFQGPDLACSYQSMSTTGMTGTVSVAGSGSRTQASGADVTRTAVAMNPVRAGDIGDREGIATQCLNQVKSSDAADVSNAIVDRWVPQVSSKWVGLVIRDQLNGRPWTAQDILTNYRWYRNQYPQARLLWTGDFPSFDRPMWGVLIAQPYSDPNSANGWCDQHGIDPDNCFAKLVRRTGTSAGTTLLRPR